VLIRQRKPGLSPSVPGLFTPRFARPRAGGRGDVGDEGGHAFPRDLGPHEGFTFPADLVGDFISVGEPGRPQDGVVQPRGLDGVSRRPERARHLVIDSRGADEDEALDARGRHRLNDPCRLRIEVASQVFADDALAADGWIELPPVQHIARHDPGRSGGSASLRISHTNSVSSAPAPASIPTA